jgi:hypothetical protein
MELLLLLAVPAAAVRLKKTLQMEQQIKVMVEVIAAAGLEQAQEAAAGLVV